MLSRSSVLLAATALIHSHFELGEVAGIHDDVDLTHFAELDDEYEGRADLAACRPYRTGFTVNECGRGGLRPSLEHVCDLRCAAHFAIQGRRTATLIVGGRAYRNIVGAQQDIR